jgi:hypothetical protein
MSDPLAKSNIITLMTLKLWEFEEFITESELSSRFHVVVDKLTKLHHGQRRSR